MARPPRAAVARELAGRGLGIGRWALGTRTTKLPCSHRGRAGAGRLLPRRFLAADPCHPAAPRPVSPWRRPRCIRRALHLGIRRCNSLADSRSACSSRLGCRAHRSSRCDAGATPRAVGAEQCASGDGLTMPAAARVIREPVRNQLGGRPIRASVANQRLRGQERLRRIFELTLSRWPHRAGRPTWLVRHAPRCSALLAQGACRA
jgi:hypothetical protein